MRRFKWLLLSLHVLIWLALAASAYAYADSYRFASCWQLIIFFLPPLQFLLLAIAVTSPVALLMSLFNAEARAHWGIPLAWHGVILTLGLAGCSRAAYAAVGPVSCL